MCCSPRQFPALNTELTSEKYSYRMNFMVKWLAANGIILFRWALWCSPEHRISKKLVLKILHLKVERNQLVKLHTILESHPTTTLASFAALFLPRSWNLSPS
jgi:hypothetical protein